MTDRNQNRKQQQHVINLPPHQSTLTHQTAPTPSASAGYPYPMRPALFNVVFSNGSVQICNVSDVEKWKKFGQLNPGVLVGIRPSFQQYPGVQQYYNVQNPLNPVGVADVPSHGRSSFVNGGVNVTRPVGNANVVGHPVSSAGSSSANVIAIHPTHQHPHIQYHHKVLAMDKMRQSSNVNVEMQGQESDTMQQPIYNNNNQMNNPSPTKITRSFSHLSIHSPTKPTINFIPQPPLESEITQITAKLNKLDSLILRAWSTIESSRSKITNLDSQYMSYCETAEYIELEFKYYTNSLGNDDEVNQLKGVRELMTKCRDRVKEEMENVDAVKGDLKEFMAMRELFVKEFDVA
ncbi:hypothetical protein HDU76_005080 [Blyttiomyces sp. JEL0837]|nr:hypothetical protein HDU76_005080 [Blyttiomyces sp. JEL0837]